LGGVITGVPGAILIGVINPTPTGGWGDTFPTIPQIQQYCTLIDTVSVPSTRRGNKGGKSVEQVYICPDGSYWTIHTLYNPNGTIVEPPHVRPGKPKYGPNPDQGRL
jgi:hypothetical protein